MKHALIASGHSLIPKKWAKEWKADLFKESRAFCSCGAWADNLTLMSYSAWSRKWHDNHKIEVMRKRGELEDDD